MGNFSKDTFDKLKHYVGVRLQQGVPLVDADWNEQEDIRRYELQAFLKWFVGNGVPEGNDGFRIISIVNKIILTSNKNDDGVSSVEVNRENSTAAKILGFGPSNYLASRAAPPAAQLTGEVTGDFEFKEKGLTLVVSANGQPKETVTFRQGTFTAAQVAEAINSAMSNLTASAGDGNDFDIKGGDGTAEGAGRCLVEGWDAINESDLKYSAQRLFNNKKLAGGKKWDVEPVKPLTTPELNRTDTVYLDVWEREVNALEDKDLFNRDIGVGVETCVRLKREWVVRVAQGTNETKLDAPPAGHVYYPLATLERVAKEAAIDQEDITDLRRTGVVVSPEEITIKDGNVGIGTLTPQNKLQLGGGDIAIGDNQHRAGKIRLWQELNNEDDRVSHAIGTERFHNIYGAGKEYQNNSIGHKFYRGGGELIAQIGFGGSRRPVNRLNSYFRGNVGIGAEDPRARLEVTGDVKVKKGDVNVTGDVKVMGNFIKDVKKTSPLSGPSWYRIAEGLERGKNNAGIFDIRWSTGERHGHVRFAVGAHYGFDNGSQITILDQSSYATTVASSSYSGKIVEKIRLLMKSTNDRHFIEFYFKEKSKAVPFVIYQYSGYGWSLIEPSPGSIPNGYTAHELRADVLFATRSGIKGGVFTVNNDAKVGIMRDNPEYPLHMGGGAYCTGKSWIEGSSIEYKKDVTPLTQDKALETLAGLSPVTFRYDEEAEDEKHVGFIAEEVPELVATKERKGLSSMDIVGILTRVVQHQQKEIEELKARLNKGQ